MAGRRPPQYALKTNIKMWVCSKSLSKQAKWLLLGREGTQKLIQMAPVDKCGWVASASVNS